MNGKIGIFFIALVLSQNVLSDLEFKTHKSWIIWDSNEVKYFSFRRLVWELYANFKQWYQNVSLCNSKKNLPIFFKFR